MSDEKAASPEGLPVIKPVLRLLSLPLTTLFLVVSVGQLMILNPASQHLIGMTFLLHFRLVLCIFRFLVVEWPAVAERLCVTIHVRLAVIQVRLTFHN